MDSGFSMRSTYLYIVLSLLVILVIFFKDSFNTRTTLVFCDVGQGDGAYIRIANRFDIVVDAGPDQRILDCLGKYMPFYDRTIELAFLSHSQRDHYGGFNSIFKRYQVDNFLLSPIDNSATSFATLKTLIIEKNIRAKSFYTGQVISFGNWSVRSFWPTNQFISSNIIRSKKKAGFYETRIDLNNFSQVFLLTIGTTKILFPGDISPSSEQIMLKKQLPTATIFKIPHHGSKNGLIEPFLQAVDPKIAVISVSKNNSFGHPSPKIIKMLKKYHLQIRRTDQEGDIVFRF